MATYRGGCFYSREIIFLDGEEPKFPSNSWSEIWKQGSASASVVNNWQLSSVVVIELLYFQPCDEPEGN